MEANLRMGKYMGGFAAVEIEVPAGKSSLSRAPIVAPFYSTFQPLTSTTGLAVPSSLAR